MTDNGSNKGFQAPPPVPTKAAIEAAGVKICVGIPLERSIQCQAFVAFWRIAQRGWPIIERYYGRKDVNRNRFAQHLLDSDCTHLLMLDSDHMHPADTVERHARWVIEDPTRRVVAGLHFRRGEPFEPCAFVADAEGKLRSPVQWEQGLHEVHSVGFGSVLINRSVFEAIPRPWFANNYAHADEDRWPGEDMYFSYMCRTHGIPIYVDFTTSSDHLITTAVNETVFRAYLQDHMDRVKVNDGATSRALTDAEKKKIKAAAVNVPEMKTRIIG